MTKLNNKKNINYLFNKFFKIMEKTEKIGQETVNETTSVVVEKKFLGLTKKAWKKIGITVGAVTLAVGSVIAVKKYKAAKAAKVAANNIEVEQPQQVEETTETPRETKNDHRFGGNYNRRDRWNNTNNN